MKTFKTQRPLLGCQNGFTLIEALIAMSIFAIGFMAIATLVFSTTRNNTTGNILTQATMLASEKMEDLKSIEDVVNLADGEESNIDNQGEPGGIYTRRWSVSNPLANSTSRQVQVSVSWDRRGQRRSVVLTTITRGNGT